MAMMIGNDVVKGVPFINGKPAKKCPDEKCCLCRDAMKEVLSEWLCPECGAHLSKEHLICLNGCHLSAPAMARFTALLVEADARVKARNKAAMEGMKSTSVEKCKAVEDAMDRADARQAQMDKDEE